MSRLKNGHTMLDMSADFWGRNLSRISIARFEMARAFPYHRLPLKSLSLAALVKHFFDQEVDKTLQKADWGGPPALPSSHRVCGCRYRMVQRTASPSVRHPAADPHPSEDEPSPYQGYAISNSSVPLKKAQIVRTGIRDAVKEFMTTAVLHPTFEIRARYNARHIQRTSARSSSSPWLKTREPVLILRST